MRLKIEIATGNDAVRDEQHVAQLLRQLATQLVAGDASLRVGAVGNIRDHNGNTVGRWEVRA